MSKRNELYKCSESGQIVEVLVGGECGVAGMEHVVENTTDAATEKHVPVVEKIEGGYRVTVGEVEHPMTEAHSILWIELVTNNNENKENYDFIEIFFKNIWQFQRNTLPLQPLTRNKQYKLLQ